MNLQEWKEQKAQLAEAQKKLNKECRAVFEEGAQEIFRQFPIKSFGWRQYTDYFNDGDPCHFHAYIWDIYMNGERCGENRDRELTSEEEKIVETISNFLKQFSSDDYENMFGDHAKIEVTPKGITVSRYTSHD